MASATANTRTPPSTTNKLGGGRCAAYTRGAFFSKARRCVGDETISPRVVRRHSANHALSRFKAVSWLDDTHHQRSVLDESRASSDSFPLPPFSHFSSSSKESLLSTDSSVESDVPLVRWCSQPGPVTPRAPSSSSILYPCRRPAPACRPRPARPAHRLRTSHRHPLRRYSGTPRSAAGAR